MRGIGAVLLVAAVTLTGCHPAPTVRTVSWRARPYHQHHLPPFPHSVRDRHVPWCTTGDLHVHETRPQPSEQMLYAYVFVRNVSNRPCGLQGPPHLTAYSPTGTYHDRLDDGNSFEARRWIRLRPGGRRAGFMLDIAALVTDCYQPITNLYVSTGHGAGATPIRNLDYRPRCRRGQHPVRRLFSVGDWTRNLGGETFPRLDDIEPRIRAVQRSVVAGGHLHFQLEFIGRRLGRLRHPCVPIHLDAFELGGTGRNVGYRAIWLRCSTDVSLRGVHDLRFNLQLRIDPTARHRIFVDVFFPIEIGGLYDTEEDGQDIRIRVLPMSVVRTTMER